MWLSSNEDDVRVQTVACTHCKVTDSNHESDLKNGVARASGILDEGYRCLHRGPAEAFMAMPDPPPISVARSRGRRCGHGEHRGVVW